MEIYYKKKLQKVVEEMNKELVTSIRILPNDKGTFSKESEFKYFIENTMIKRGGDYYFPNLMMNCPRNTFVLFQYDGMIRAIGLLSDLEKALVVDERGVSYAGYYKFDTDTLVYLDSPLDKDMLKLVYPEFNSFSQSKQVIPLKYLDDILDLLESTNSVSIDDDNHIISEIDSTVIDGEEKAALIKIRVNQGVFRDRLLKRYSKCCLCGIKGKSFLVASHIKPWAVSESKEKLDVDNGLLLCPNHDRLFDGGWISFDNNGNILISDELNVNNRIFMNVREDMKISLTDKNKQYLDYHRENILRKQ